MKKYLVALCLGFAALTGTARSQGDMGIGVDLGVAPCLEDGVDVTNFGFGLKYQYYLNDPFRLQANLEYWFKDKGVDVFDITVNGHYLVDLGNKFTIYPTAGIGYGSIGGMAFKVQIPTSGQPVLDIESKTLSRFVFNIGIGGEYEISDAISVGLEFKYRYMKDFSQLPINFGVTYHF